MGVARAQIVYSHPAKYNEKTYTIKYDEKQVWEFYMGPIRAVTGNGTWPCMVKAFIINQE
jgi:hypothetical protein